MKKAILALALVVTGLTSFGQGYFVFTTSTRQVWDTITGSPTTYKPDAGLDVAFLWSTTSTALVAGLATSTATNGTTQINSYATAWTDILSGTDGFSLATNSGSSTLAEQQTSSVGAVNYDSSGTFGVSGTTAGATVYLYAIAWSDAYSTPQAAAAAGAPVGWSNVFSYASGASSIATGLDSFTQAGMVPFGLATATPEPSTIALAGMGIASLLAFRRRK